MNDGKLPCGRKICGAVEAVDCRECGVKEISDPWPCPECGEKYPNPHKTGCAIGEAYRAG